MFTFAFPCDIRFIHVAICVIKPASPFVMGIKITARMMEYERYLNGWDFACGTIESYIWTAAYFERNYGEPSKESPREYRH